MVEEVSSTPGSDTWILPFVYQPTEQSFVNANSIDDNIDRWKDAVGLLLSECPADNTFSMWKTFLLKFRNENLPDMQRKAKQWPEESLFENMRKLHQDVTQTILTELRTAVIHECHKELQYVHDRLSELNSSHHDNVNVLKKEIYIYREWFLKTIVDDVANPNIVTEFAERREIISQRIDAFHAKLRDRALPDDAQYPAPVDFHRLLLTPYCTSNTVSAFGLPSLSPPAIASRFDSAAIFVKTLMKKLEEEFVKPFYLALNGTSYEGLLDRIIQCYEDQNELAQNFWAECTARAEMVRDGCKEDLTKENEDARLANSKARDLINDVLTALRNQTRSCLLRLYVTVLDDMEESVVKLGSLNTNHRTRRRLEQRKAVKKHWRKYFMDVMKGLRRDTSIVLITNLKENQEYFQKAIVDSSSYVEKFWEMIKPCFFK